MKKSNRAAQEEAKKKDRQIKQQLRRARQVRKYGDADWKKDWQKFNEQLSAIGLTIKDVAGDGNCMFRAIADQLEGDPSKHDNYRQRICDYIERNAEDFAPFVEDDRTLSQHLAEMRRNATWGGHMELQAASLLLRINLCIHQLSQPRWEIVNHSGKPPRTVHLSYHDGDHYASVRNANEPSDRTGAPTPIAIQSTSPNASSSNASGDGFSSWQEELVLRSTCASNVYFVRAVLLEVSGDTDAAIEYIIALSHDGELEVNFQNEFAYEHGIFPEGGLKDEFDDSLLQYIADTDMIDAVTASPSLSSSSPHSETASATPDGAHDSYPSSSTPYTDNDATSKNTRPKSPEYKPKYKGKPKEEAATTSSSAPHPKLEKFYQNTHLTNKQRNALRRMEKEKPPPPTVAAPAAISSDASEAPLTDLGSLRI